MTHDELPLADPGREAWAKEQFPIESSPELYAAQEGHRWASFSLDEVRYSDEALNGWVQRLGDILFGRNGAPSLTELRLRLLSAEDQSAIQAEIQRLRHES